jgi:ABC-type branched-subunit amino acid transport system substrate-binding protein
MTAFPSPSVTPERPLWKRVLQSHYARIFKNFVVLPLIGTLIAGTIIGRIVDAIIGPKSFFVYIVGDQTDISNQELMTAAAGGGDFKPSLDGATPIKTEIRSDLGDPDKAKGIAQELVRRPDVLMIVGHGSSTSSQRALPIYMQADPPIPVILTTETNPALLPPPPPLDDRVPPVFRLFPTDDNQATVAADFIVNQGAKSVWIVEDTNNPTYSQYLARTFLNAVYDKQPSLKVVLRSNSLTLPPYAVDRLGIDWVFFAGEWRSALVLVRQLQAMQGIKKAKVLLSDASVDNLFWKYGGADVEGVYLLHPLEADAFKKNGYATVGAEANKLANALIDNAHQQFDDLATKEAPVGYRLRKWLGLRRVSDARRALARFMALAVNKDLPLTEDQIRMGRDEKSHSIIRKDAFFHVWRVTNQTVVPAK